MCYAGCAPPGSIEARQYPSRSPKWAPADPLSALVKPLAGTCYKDNGKIMHLDRVCPISITLCCFQIWFHLPVAIPWAPPCVGIRTLQLDLQGLDHFCTWRDRTEQRDRSDSKLHTRAEEKWFVFSRAPWAKIGGWADRKQRLQLHFSCLECDKPSVPSQHILVRRMVKGWRTYCLCNKTKMLS